MALQSPNYTTVPNEIFDTWMNQLNGSELKILLLITRKTLGFSNPDGTRKKEDAISLSQIVKFTGLSKPQIIKSLKILEQKFDLITSVKSTCKTTVFSLKFDSNKSKLVKKVNQTSKESLQDEPETSKESLHTKESNINKLVQNKNIVRKNNNESSLYKSVIKIFSDGFYELNGVKWSWSGDKAKINGRIIKKLIKIGLGDAVNLPNPNNLTIEQLAYLEIRRRSEILYKHIKNGSDKFLGGLKFTPDKVSLFWDDLAVYKKQLDKKDIKKKEINDAVQEINDEIGDMEGVKFV